MLVEYLEKFPIPSWNWFFKQEKVKNALKYVSMFLTNDTIPNISTMFNAFVYTSFEDLKVVIIGQEPYPTANGLAFSCNGDVQPQLKNIYTVLKNTIPGFKTPSNGNLIPWAIQGVFLINSALTCISGKPGSHESIWIPFITLLIEQISERKKNLVFLMWGKNIQRLKERIDKNKHCILVSSHPSPYTAKQGFLECNHFQLTNEYLSSTKQDMIDWCL